MTDKKWLTLYHNVKTDMDKFLTKDPKKIHNLLNFKKLVYLEPYQASLSEIKQRRHHLLRPEQQLGIHTSRVSLLYRLRKWFSQDFHLVTRPFIRPSHQFIVEASHYFKQPGNEKSVFYGSIYHRDLDHLFHYFVLQTGRVVSPLDGYFPNKIYLLILVEGQTVEVEQLD